MKRIRCADPVAWRRGEPPPTDPSCLRSLQVQLMREIAALQTRLDNLETGSNQRDFSAQQTCREMIKSRQRLYRRLKPSLAD